jgi:uncharacterized protein (TIGR03437 family)
MRKRSIIFLLAWVGLTGSAYPRQDPETCGTHGEKGKEQLQLHRKAARRELKSGPRFLAAAPRARDIGDIAVLEDSGDLVTRYNAFDLDQKTVTFLGASPSAGSYHFETGDASYDQAAADGGTLLAGLGDDDSREISLPFAFPFYGNSYRQVFVNSDGNLTFGSPDADTSDRSLGRMVSGPPRIAPLFRDLNPTQAANGVRVLSETDRVVVSWAGVPEFSEYGGGLIETFQVRLFPSGRIEFAYAGVLTGEAVVGISPGGRLGVTALVSLSEASPEEFSGSIAERFSYLEEVDIFAAGLKFYETHEDAYDYLVLFNNMGVAAAPGAIAYEVTARNINRSGYGDVSTDIGSQFGSPRRLQSVMNMASLGQYPSDPDARVPSRGFTTGDTPMTILGHEAGHLFLAFASVRDPQDPDSRPMLKPDGAHWSFNFNSEASLLEGNRIRDNGNDTFTTTATVEGFSPLDQYLMGLLPAEQAPPTFLVANSSKPSSAFSQVGVSFSGNRRNIDVDEIVRAEGRRAPDVTVSQRHFRFAFILIVAQGTEPPAADLEKIETFRSRFADYYNRYAGAKAFAETTLRLSLQLSAAPAAGVLVGRNVSATVSIEKPASSPLTVALERPPGAVFVPVPSSVAIEAGSTSATFQITGLAPGADDLTARPSDPRFETAHARIQVAMAPSSLRLAAVPGDGQLVTLRATDANNLPYTGLRVMASVSTGGAVTPDADVSGEDGLVRFQWTPGTGDRQQLTASLEGAAPVEVEGVVNAASYSPGLAPDSFAAIFGFHMAGGAAAGAGPPPYPTELAGVQVFFDGEPAGLHYASDRQINVVVPPDAKQGTANLMVSAPGGASTIIKAPVLAASPGIFFDPATNYGAILRNGEYLEIYCTGLGTGLQVTVHLGAFQLTPSFSGLNSVFPGLDQVNVQIPAGVSGDQTLSLEVNGRRSNEVRVRL